MDKLPNKIHYYFFLQNSTDLIVFRNSVQNAAEQRSDAQQQLGQEQRRWDAQLLELSRILVLLEGSLDIC